MRHGSLFSGVGGFDLAAQRMGWENIFHCERNTFGQNILNYYWPKAISYADITKTDFSIHRGNIDILTGGFPCQPYSTAGLRKGKDDERHLWPHMLRAIREIKPRWVVGENVRGLISWNGGLVFEEVQVDLEAAGYEVQPYLLPASGVNAPHQRERIWFIAHSTNVRSCRNDGERTEGQQRRSRRSACDELNGNVCQRSAPNTYNEGGQEAGNNGGWKTSEQVGQIGHEIRNNFRPIIESRHVANPGSHRLQGGVRPEQPVSTAFQSSAQNTQGSWRDWENFPTQSPVCYGNDGIFTESLRQRIREDSMGYLSEEEIDKIFSKAFTEWRNESIKAGGNAIVHQVALQIFKAIEEYERIA